MNKMISSTAPVFEICWRSMALDGTPVHGDLKTMCRACLRTWMLEQALEHYGAKQNVEQGDNHPLVG